MTATIIILVMVTLFVLYQSLKGTLLRAVMTIFTVISASIIAFGFFEYLAGLFISKGSATRPSAMMPYWQPISFLLLFIVSFALLQAAATIIARKSVTVEPLPEKIGRALCGAVSGFLLAGVLITALGMTPLKNIPYQRFRSMNPNLERPNGALMNADGLVAGIFSIVSKGSLSGQKSFSVVHPSFINEIFLNRLSGEKDVSLVTPGNAVEIPREAAVWPAPADVKNTDGTDMTPKAGYNLTVVRVDIAKSGNQFSLSQLRLVCNLKGSEPLKGTAINVYPAGYFVGKDRIAQKKLGEKITVPLDNYRHNVKRMDLAFNVPDTYVPVMLAFKGNSIVKLPKAVGAENAPAIEPF